MKRSILGWAFCMMFVLVAQAQPAAPPAPAQGGAPGAPPARGGGGGGGRGGRGGQPVVIGPAAPVPPQVAMLRPTTQELSQINDAVKRLVASDTSPAKPLLQKYEALLTVQPPRQNTAATFTAAGPRVPRHESFVELAKAGNIDLLFHGDSITDWWDQGEQNTAMLTKHFGGIKLANFGVAGDTTQGVLWGLQNGEGQGFQPKAIMLMIGTNNMGSHTPPEIAEGIGAVTMEMRRNFPNAKILLLAIFPRGFPNDPVRERIAECNKIIQKLDDGKNVFYMDIGATFLAADGTLDATMPDRLHPNAAGYDIWGEAVKAKLAELMK